MALRYSWVPISFSAMVSSSREREGINWVLPASSGQDKEGNGIMYICDRLLSFSSPDYGGYVVLDATPARAE